MNANLVCYRYLYNISLVKLMRRLLRSQSVNNLFLLDCHYVENINFPGFKKTFLGSKMRIREKLRYRVRGKSHLILRVSESTIIQYMNRNRNKTLAVIVSMPDDLSLINVYNSLGVYYTSLSYFRISIYSRIFLLKNWVTLASILLSTIISSNSYMRIYN